MLNPCFNFLVCFKLWVLSCITELQRNWRSTSLTSADLVTQLLCSRVVGARPGLCKMKQLYMLMLFLDKMESYKISLTVFWYAPILGGDSHCESKLSFTRAQHNELARGLPDPVAHEWLAFNFPLHYPAESHFKAIRIKEMVTNCWTSCCVTNSPCQHHSKCR